MKNKIKLAIAAIAFGCISAIAHAAEVVATQSWTATGYFWITVTNQPGIKVENLYYLTSYDQIAVKFTSGSGCIIFVSNPSIYSLNPGATCAVFTITKL